MGVKRKKEMKLRRGMRVEEEQNGGTGVKWGAKTENGSGNVAPMFRGHGPLQMIPRRAVVPSREKRLTVVLVATRSVGKFLNFISNGSYLEYLKY